MPLLIIHAYCCSGVPFQPALLPYPPPCPPPGGVNTGGANCSGSPSSVAPSSPGGLALRSFSSRSRATSGSSGPGSMPSKPVGFAACQSGMPTLSSGHCVGNGGAPGTGGGGNWPGAVGGEDVGGLEAGTGGTSVFESVGGACPLLPPLKPPPPPRSIGPRRYE